MFRLVSLAVLLLQALSVFGTRCLINETDRGICRRNGTCWTNAKTRCGRTSMYCCPLAISSIDTRMNLPNPKFPENCGKYPEFRVGYITGGKKIEPDVFSWLASLEYNSSTNSLGICAGSVINSLYVITAAHCASKSSADRYGNVTAVRLGNFESGSGQYCDYGGTVCESYLHFPVAKIIPHTEYGIGDSGILINDIALIKLNREIQFTTMLQPICLPFGEKRRTWSLIACGWGKSMQWNEVREKRAAVLHVWSEEECTQDYYTDSRHICAGRNGSNTCDGDSGGPLMASIQLNGTPDRRMVLEGIVSQGYMACNNKFHPSISTRVHNFLSWIENNVDS